MCGWSNSCYQCVCAHLHEHTAVSSCCHLCAPGSSLFGGSNGPLSLALWSPIQSATAINQGKFCGVFSLVPATPESRLQGPVPTWVLTLGSAPRPAPLPSPHVASAHHGWLTGWHFPSCLVFFPPLSCRQAQSCTLTDGNINPQEQGQSRF